MCLVYSVAEEMIFLIKVKKIDLFFKSGEYKI